MIFSEINGNLFSRKMSEKDYYVHCISRDYACGAGIAKEFNKRYGLTRKLRELPVTDVMLVENVFNLVTKQKYWQKPTYESLTNSLVYLKELIHFMNDNVETLVMPRIGCGLDKLQWNKVKKIIKSVFNDTNIKIEVYYL